jgi:hypothetical protein
MSKMKVLLVDDWLILFTAHDLREVERVPRAAGIHAVVLKSNALTQLIAQAEALVVGSRFVASRNL